MKKIVLTNNKGGVTKTTSTINIGSALAKNFRVALIDFDTQKNLSMNIKNFGGNNLAEVLKNRKLALEDFAKTENKNLFILKNNGDVNVTLFNQFPVHEQAYLLLDCLDTLPEDTFDYVLIDTPPNLENQTVNALLASDYVLIPATLEVNSILGIQNTFDIVRSLQKKLKPDLKILGVFLSKYDERLTKTNTDLENNILTIVDSPDLILKSRIKTSSIYNQNQYDKMSIFESKNDSKKSGDYQSLTDEIVAIINK